MKQLNKYFKSQQINNVLDIATGKGQFILNLMETFPEAVYTGVDPDKESLKIAKESFENKNIQFLQMNAEKLEFTNNTFDIVSISNGLHHLPHLDSSFSEMKRVLNPNGRIIISEIFNDNLNPAQENQKFYHHLKGYADRLSGHFHHKTWTRNEVLKIIQQHGIHIELSFDYYNDRVFISETEDVDFWVNRLKDHLDILKDNDVYRDILPKIEEFRKRIEKDGMQQATNVVAVGKLQ